MRKFAAFLRYAFFERHLGKGTDSFISVMVPYFIVMSIFMSSSIWLFPSPNKSDLTCLSGSVSKVYGKKGNTRNPKVAEIIVGERVEVFHVGMVRSAFIGAEGKAINFCYVGGGLMPVVGLVGGLFDRHIVEISSGGSRQISFSDTRQRIDKNTARIRNIWIFAMPIFVVFSTILMISAARELKEAKNDCI